MLTLDSLNADRTLYVFLASHFAERALSIWEKEYPEDMRSKKAIEAAKEWLSNPGKETAAGAAAYAAANAAAIAAGAAAWTAHADAAACAARAAANAARALNADKESLIHEVILESLDWILQHKIENGQSFANPELILDYLDEEQKQSFLFNLDAVA